MKRRIVVLGLLIAMMLGMVSVATAQCPNLNAVLPPDSYGDVTKTTSGTQVTYNVQVTGSSPVQGFCVIETDQNKLVNLAEVGSSPLSWTFSHPDSQNSFDWSGSGSQLLMPTQSSDIGTVDFGSNPMPTSGEKYVLHISDPDVCGSAGTCFVFPGPGQPIPELNPLILTLTGLVGLVLVTKRFKK